jgi:long-chain acyl-CoA synthetase
MDERCTALHGVPTMFSAVMSAVKPGMKFPQLRSGIAAGSPVPRKMMEEIRGILNMKEITNSYGTSLEISQ